MSFLLPIAGAIAPTLIDWIGGWWEDTFGDEDEDDYYEDDYGYGY